MQPRKLRQNDHFRWANLFTTLIWVCLLGYAPYTGSQTAAQELEPDLIERIDEHVTKYMEELGIPGIAIGIIDAGEVVYLRGYGVADDSGREMTPQTPFQLASVSKSFTALAIMQLVEADMLELDAPVADILDWFPYDDITVRHLLHHTSGFSTFSSESYLTDGTRGPDVLETTMQRTVTNYPPVREAGTDYEYSNTNYDLLGLIVQTVAGQAFQSYVEENIFAPLNMQHSHASIDDALADDATQGYSLFMGRLRSQETSYTDAFAGAGALFSSAEDMTHYHLALLNGGEYEGGRILSEAGVTTLHTPGFMHTPWRGYAMGWLREPFLPIIEDDGTYAASQPYVVRHNGSWHNVRTNQWLIPEKGQAVVVLLNGNNVSKQSLDYNLPYGILQIINGIEDMEETSPVEGFLEMHGQVLFLVVLLLWIVMALLAMRAVWRWWRKLADKPANPLRVARVIGIPLLLDVVIITVLLSLPGIFETTLRGLFVGSRDAAVLFPSIIAVAAGWGLIRTVLYIWILIVQRRASNPTA